MTSPPTEGLIRIYKAAQGRTIRVGTAIGLAVVDLALCYYVGALLQTYLGEAPYKTYLVYAVPAALFAALAIAEFLVLNRPAVVDFMVATESEMKKVSWPGRAELLGSTGVVLVTVVLLAALIFVVDFVFNGGLSKGFRMGPIQSSVAAVLAGLALAYGLARALDRRVPPYLAYKKHVVLGAAGLVVLAVAALALTGCFAVTFRVPGLGLW